MDPAGVSPVVCGGARAAVVANDCVVVALSAVVSLASGLRAMRFCTRRKQANPKNVTSTTAEAMKREDPKNLYHLLLELESLPAVKLELYRSRTIIMDKIYVTKKVSLKS